MFERRRSRQYTQHRRTGGGNERNVVVMVARGERGWMDGTNLAVENSGNKREEKSQKGVLKQQAALIAAPHASRVFLQHLGR